MPISFLTSFCQERPRNRKRGTRTTAAPSSTHHAIRFVRGVGSERITLRIPAERPLPMP